MHRLELAALVSSAPARSRMIQLSLVLPRTGAFDHKRPVAPAHPTLAAASGSSMSRLWRSSVRHRTLDSGLPLHDAGMPRTNHPCQADPRTRLPGHRASAAHGCGEGPPDPRENRLLRALPDPIYQRWLDHLTPVDMPLGMVLGEVGQPVEYVYFPTTCIIALSYGLQSGQAAAVSIIGREAVVGVAMFMGSQSSLDRAVVIGGGQGFRLAAAPLMREFNQVGATTRLLLLYTQALMVQIAQAVVCIRHHSLDQRLCRFLLSSLDRIDGTEVKTTHDLISSVLGVRREGVTQTMANLQDAGLIRYGRGHITVVDRPGLERRTCECHAVVKKEYARLQATRCVD